MDFGLRPGLPRKIVLLNKHLYERNINFAILLFLLKEVFHASSCFLQDLLFCFVLFLLFGVQCVWIVRNLELMNCLIIIVSPFRWNKAVVPAIVTQQASLCYLTIWLAMSSFESKHVYKAVERKFLNKFIAQIIKPYWHSFFLCCSLCEHLNCCFPRPFFYHTSSRQVVFLLPFLVCISFWRLTMRMQDSLMNTVLCFTFFHLFFLWKVMMFGFLVHVISHH